MRAEKQRQFDINYLKMTLIWGQNSVARRRKVGALIVKDNRILSDGYNGTPSGFDNNCEDELPDGTLVTKKEVLHAEANAITKIARSTESSEGATLYLTCSPCVDCAKLILQAGIARVVYKDDYHSNAGIDLLTKAGIKVEQIKFDFEV